jgi:hypothetical protein
MAVAEPYLEGVIIGSIFRHAAPVASLVRAGYLKHQHFETNAPAYFFIHSSQPATHSVHKELKTAWMHYGKGSRPAPHKAFQDRARGFFQLSYFQQ